MCVREREIERHKEKERVYVCERERVYERERWGRKREREKLTYMYFGSGSTTLNDYREDDVFLLLDADELPTREALLFLKETIFALLRSKLGLVPCKTWWFSSVQLHKYTYFLTYVYVN